MSNAATHSEDCYLWHHDCAVKRVQALREAAQQALEALMLVVRSDGGTVSYSNGSREAMDCIRALATLRSALEEIK